MRRVHPPALPRHGTFSGHTTPISQVRVSMSVVLQQRVADAGREAHARERRGARRLVAPPPLRPRPIATTQAPAS